MRYGGEGETSARCVCHLFIWDARFSRLLSMESSLSYLFWSHDYSQLQRAKKLSGFSLITLYQLMTCLISQQNSSFLVKGKGGGSVVIR